MTFTKICLFITAIVAFFSCKRNFDDNSNPQSIQKQNQLFSEKEDPEYRDGPTVLGDQLENPYRLSMMRKAVDSLRYQDDVQPIEQLNVRCNYLYVRFEPTDSVAYDTLVADESISFYDYPLDHKITQIGNSYHDPNLPDSTITYQYASVPVDYNFISGINYVILDSLYIPEQDNQLDLSDEPVDIYITKLIDKALVLTNNAEDTVKVSSEYPLAGRYHPQGKIEVFDTRLNTYIGFESVTVKARRWFTTHSALTDYNGNYYMEGDFKYACNYSIVYKRAAFYIRRQAFGTAVWIDGPRKKGAWNYQIYEGYNRFAAHVYRGINTYMYGNNDGLSVHDPWGQPMIIALDGKGGNQEYGSYNFGTWLHGGIRVYRFKEDDSELWSDDVFGTAVHEFGHYNHRKLIGQSDYANSLRLIRESWALAIQWRLTHLEYASRGITNYGNFSYAPTNRYPILPLKEGYQYWNSNISSDYTTLFINLVDNFNEFGYPFVGSALGSVNDQVSGYTMASLEQDVVKLAASYSGLVSRLKAVKPTGVTDAQIDLLTGYY